MKRRAIMILVGCLCIVSSAITSFSQDDIKIWKEFVTALKSGRLTMDQIRPYEAVSRETLMKTLTDFREYADKASSWNEWDVTPEAFPVGDQVHFLVSLGFGGQTKSVFCFTFLKEGERWYYRHLENIFIRLDKTPNPPTSEFPDLSEETKAWQREELYWSQMVYFHNVLVKEKGNEFFLNMLRDGPGYYLAAKVWVPFVLPQRAFILYLCWEQSRLRRNYVILEKLTDEEAVVKLQTHFFFLYKRTGHLKEQISFDDYRRIFETIWQDRAANAGWKLEISYSDKECLECIFRFTRNI